MGEYWNQEDAEAFLSTKRDLPMFMWDLRNIPDAWDKFLGVFISAYEQGRRDGQTDK